MDVFVGLLFKKLTTEVGLYKIYLHGGVIYDYSRIC